MITEARDQYPPDIRHLLTYAWWADLGALVDNGPPPILYRTPALRSDRPLYVEEIIKIVANVTGVSPEQIAGPRRVRHVVFARRASLVAIHVLRPELSVRETLPWFGRLSRYSVAEAITRWKVRRFSSVELEHIKTLERRLGCRLRP